MAITAPVRRRRARSKSPKTETPGVTGKTDSKFAIGNDRTNVQLKPEVLKMLKGETAEGHFAHPIESIIVLLGMAIEKFRGNANGGDMDAYIHQTYPYFDAQYEISGKPFSSLCAEVCDAYPEHTSWVTMVQNDKFQPKAASFEFNMEKSTHLFVVYFEDALSCFSIIPATATPEGNLYLKISENCKIVQIIYMEPEAKPIQKLTFSKSTSVVKPYGSTVATIAVLLNSSPPRTLSSLTTELTKRYPFYRYYSAMYSGRLDNYVQRQIKENPGLFDTRVMNGVDGKEVGYFLKTYPGSLSEEGQFSACSGPQDGVKVVMQLYGWMGTDAPDMEEEDPELYGETDLITGSSWAWSAATITMDKTTPVQAASDEKAPEAQETGAGDQWQFLEDGKIDVPVDERPDTIQYKFAEVQDKLKKRSTTSLVGHEKDTIVN